MTGILLVILYVAAGVAASWEARRKGYNDLIWLGLGVVLGPIALLLMLFLPQRQLMVGTVVKTAAPITLDGGARIPAGHVSVVRATSIIDATVVCRISAPDTTHHWVAQEALTRTGHVAPLPDHA